MTESLTPDSSDSPPEEALVPPSESEPIVLTEADLLDNSVESLPSSSWKLPGPNLFVAILWMIVIGLVQLVGAAIGAVIFAPELMDAVLQSKSLELSELSGHKFVGILATTQATFVVFAIVAAMLVYRRKLPSQMPLRLPTARHLGMILALMLPLALFDGFVAQEVAKIVYPATADNDQSEVPIIEIFERIAESGSFGVLLFTLAIAPAIGEEIIFRGIIGRGMLARFGLVGGIAITSILFAVVHMEPAQSAGVLTIGVVMHVAYLATRSFWVPMLIHFLNNSLPVLMVLAMTQQADANAEEVLSEASPLSWVGVLTAFIAIVLWTTLLWKTRLEYRHADDGKPILTDVPTVEPPADSIPYTEEFRTAPAGLVIAAILSLVAFFASAILTAPSV